MVTDLQAVVLPGGEGSKMFPLTEGVPKCLLPISNMPMIWYVVNYLEKSGLKDIIIVVQSDAASRVTQLLHTLFQEISFDVVSLPDEDNLGTADALRLVKDKIKSDVLIVSSDMVTNIPLHRLIDVHRTYDASFTAMLAKRVELQTEARKPDKKKTVDPNFGTRDLVAVDRKEGRLIFLNNEADLEQDNITFKKSTLKQYPHLKIETELSDCHLYVMKNWLLHYLCNDFKIENIKSDFVPHVLRKQFSKPKKVAVEDDLSFMDDKMLLNDVMKDIFSCCVVDELTEYMRDWSGYNGRCLKDKIKCHCVIADGFCLRINTLPAYTHINKEFHKLKDTIALPKDQQTVPVHLGEKSHVGNDCSIGKLVNLGNTVTIKKSVVGENCNIGSNVKINNCILMNNVMVSEGCKLQNSIICENANIQQNCVIINCQVTAGYNLEENSEVENEAIVHEEMEFEE